MANLSKRTLPIPISLLSPARALVTILVVVKTINNPVTVLAVVKTLQNPVTILAVVKTLNNPTTRENAYHYAPSTRFSHS